MANGNRCSLARWLLWTKGRKETAAPPRFSAPIFSPAAAALRVAAAWIPKAPWPRFSRKGPVAGEPCKRIFGRPRQNACLPKLSNPEACQVASCHPWGASSARVEVITTPHYGLCGKYHPVHKVSQTWALPEETGKKVPARRATTHTWMEGALKMPRCKPNPGIKGPPTNRVRNDKIGCTAHIHG